MHTTNLPNPDFCTLDIEGMTCASCVGRVEKVLNQLPGVEAATVNLATEQARVRLQKDAAITADRLIAAIQKSGYGAKISPPRGNKTSTRTQSFWAADGLGRVILGFGLATPLVIPMLLMPFGMHWSISPLWQFALATPAQFILGWRFYRSGYRSLMSGAGNMDLLVAIGTSSAYGLSIYQMFLSPQAHGELYFEGSTIIICMVLLGKWLEARAKQQTSEAIRALQKLWPEQAKVLSPDPIIDERNTLNEPYRTIPLDQVLPKDRILVLPGERLPVDGIILSGLSHIDESLLTGESAPIKKGINDKVIGGALNGEGALIIQAQAIGVDSILSKIITLVEDAQTQKAPIQKLVDQVSSVFVPGVILIAITTGIANWLYYDSAIIAILRAVSVLVIACPCALGLATPAAIMAGTGVAARFGILIKDPQVLEYAHRLTIVAFDKTGTLTIGQPRLLDIIPLAPGVDRDAILMAIAGLQLGSEHPLAKAVLVAAKAKGLTPYATTESRALPGIGIEGTPSAGPWSGMVLSLQSIASLQNHPSLAVLPDQAADCFKAGQTASVLLNATSNLPIAIITFGDELKDQAKPAIHALHHMRIRTVMITGDNRAAATRIGALIDIDEVFAEIMPSEKAKIIRQLQNPTSGKRQWVAMVGDGINDAPALATADVGMAMSTGTDVAMQAAGITLMRGNPTLVGDAIDISKKTWRKIQQNLFWAFIFNATGIPLAALGYLSPMLAGSAMALSSFCVLSNALLLKRWHPK